MARSAGGCGHGAAHRGDAPTESGIPGWRLWTEWRLPKWLAFKAGGAFEVGVLWVSMSIFGVLLLPGVLPLLIG